MPDPTGDRVRQLALAASVVLVASGFVFGIGYGFEIAEGGSALSPYLPFAGLVVLLSLGTLIWAIGKQGGWAKRPFLFQTTLGRKTTVAERKAVEEQVAQQKAYVADPQRLATCHHLQPVEKAMREAGIETRLLYGTVIQARCTVDESRLSLEPPVVFYGDVPGDRPGEPPSAHFSCPEHSSAISVDHRDSAQPSLPVFPAR